MKPFSFWRIPWIALFFLVGRPDKCSFIEIIPFEKATLENAQTLAHYDGESKESKSTLNVKAVPKSLHIFVGKLINKRWN
jgi:hypothetical protein